MAEATFQIRYSVEFDSVEPDGSTCICGEQIFLNQWRPRLVFPNSDWNVIMDWCVCDSCKGVLVDTGK